MRSQHMSSTLQVAEQASAAVTSKRLADPVEEPRVVAKSPSKKPRIVSERDEDITPFAAPHTKVVITSNKDKARQASREAELKRLESLHEPTVVVPVVASLETLITPPLLVADGTEDMSSQSSFLGVAPRAAFAIAMPALAVPEGAEDMSSQSSFFGVAPRAAVAIARPALTVPEGAEDISSQSSFFGFPVGSSCVISSPPKVGAASTPDLVEAAEPMDVSADEGTPVTETNNGGRPRRTAAKKAVDRLAKGEQDDGLDAEPAEEATEAADAEEPDANENQDAREARKLAAAAKRAEKDEAAKLAKAEAARRKEELLRQKEDAKRQKDEQKLQRELEVQKKNQEREDAKKRKEDEKRQKDLAKEEERVRKEAAKAQQEAERAKRIADEAALKAKREADKENKRLADEAAKAKAIEDELAKKKQAEARFFGMLMKGSSGAPQTTNPVKAVSEEATVETKAKDNKNKPNEAPCVRIKWTAEDTQRLDTLLALQASATPTFLHEAKLRARELKRRWHASRRELVRRHTSIATAAETEAMAVDNDDEVAPVTVCPEVTAQLDRILGRPVVARTNPPLIHGDRIVQMRHIQHDGSIRPPYFGSCMHVPKFANPRRPFLPDPEYNYDDDYDSDQDWDEADAEIGESLSSCEEDEEEMEATAGLGELSDFAPRSKKAEKRKVSREEDELAIDEEMDDFVVPHGYLSDDEGVDAAADEDDADDDLGEFADDDASDDEGSDDDTSADDADQPTPSKPAASRKAQPSSMRVDSDDESAAAPAEPRLSTKRTHSESQSGEANAAEEAAARKKRHLQAAELELKKRAQNLVSLKIGVLFAPYAPPSDESVIARLPAGLPANKISRAVALSKQKTLQQFHFLAKFAVNPLFDFGAEGVDPFNFAPPAAFVAATTGESANPAEPGEAATLNSNVKAFTDDLLPELVRMVHGTSRGVDPIGAEFVTRHPEVSKRQTIKKLLDIAVKEVRPAISKKPLFFVKDQMLASLGLESLQPAYFAETAARKAKQEAERQQRQQLDATKEPQQPQDAQQPTTPMDSKRQQLTPPTSGDKQKRPRKRPSPTTATTKELFPLASFLSSAGTQRQAPSHSEQAMTIESVVEGSQGLITPASSPAGQKVIAL
ncbi:hypothetical protein, variant 1 [Capsaspora owczarzaki ATCC 30864]|uniref:Chromatin assembly factor 1 subunit A dimerization domain-containing protein n=1 Tax=Capsaspora owczarzaki (strain ATCC 30864) TaxID=595528 RepID=A0A0D2WL13_CAPO3|nr:hypothetical protein, variant 1 [Capsaspora owczarzaki ATCC 30864]